LPLPFTKPYRMVVDPGDAQPELNEHNNATAAVCAGMMNVHQSR
jgi:hypothetical protein